MADRRRAPCDPRGGNESDPTELLSFRTREQGRTHAERARRRLPLWRDPIRDRRRLRLRILSLLDLPKNERRARLRLGESPVAGLLTDEGRAHPIPLLRTLAPILLRDLRLADLSTNGEPARRRIRPRLRPGADARRPGGGSTDRPHLVRLEALLLRRSRVTAAVSSG